MNQVKAIKQDIRTVGAANGPISYQLSRKKVKNVNLCIDRNGQIKVSAPPHVPVKFIDDFVREKEGFIRKAIEKIENQPQERAEFFWKTGNFLSVLGQAYPLIVQEGRKEGVKLEADRIYLTVKPGTTEERKEALWKAWQKKLAKEVLGESLFRMGKMVAPYGITCREWNVRQMSSRWGSCQPGKGRITLNTRLVEAPREAIDYVVLHELAHMKFPHHQKAFYEFIARFMPDWKERKGMLKGIIS